MKKVVIIPARLGSTRLPRKVLIELCGKPMIQHVYEAAIQAIGIDAVYIATDSTEVEEVCTHFTPNIIMTRREHISGTDRLAEAIEQIDCEGVINVQGDEPLMDPALITQLAEALEGKGSVMVSAMHRIKPPQEITSPNAVKVVVDNSNNALYFSRSVIPYHRDDAGLPYYRHIGIYGYTKEFLLAFASMDQTPLEQAEKLEQLRVLEHGHRIQMIETAYEPIGVDVAADLERVKRIMRCR